MQTIEKILILDYGSQYTQLITRRFRECEVLSEIVSWDHDEAEMKTWLESGLIKGIVLSGGPSGIHDEDAPTISPMLLECGIPILAICYGMQAIAACYGGEVHAGETREYGQATVRLRGHSPLFTDIADFTTAEGHGMISVWMSHGDHVASLPPGFIGIASTDSLPIAGMMHLEKPIYCLQFHPEVAHTPQGMKILRRFAHDICNCDRAWKMDDFIERSIRQIREQVGLEQVILGLSGGVDSAVAAALIHRAIGDQLHCVFIDHGLLRLDEGDEVMKIFAHEWHMDVERVNAQDRFFSAMSGVTDPEQKRKIIGALFVEEFDLAAQRQINTSRATWLAQGTIYPDVVESAGSKTKKAHNIKSHHNVGGLPDRLNLKLLEPLRDLFKDEVRKIGRLLGLPESLISRHPFPGPGLAVRILGDITAEKVRMLQEADAVFIEGLRHSGWYAKTSQAFAVFLPVQSVGVMGDGRTYQHAIALRAVQTEDFMTAHHAPIPHELLGHWAQQIVNRVRGINRVVYDITSKPPATIEWE
jgi:GMP synthase (glutamine-hydrolysing)